MALEVEAFSLGLRNRFRGITVREGLLLRGPAGWAEWSPFAEYARPEIDAWWAATVEAATVGFPAPVRDRVPVNVTVPAVPAERAHEIVAASGCRTAKVKVAEPGQVFAEDLARVEAVRDALGPDGRVRVDVNGLWSVDEALRRLRELARFGLEYAEQPCASVAELADLRLRLARAGTDVPIAADESIRRSGDPERVVAEHAADIAVLKVQPLGGVRRCLELADRLGLPVVVSSALESSVGLAAGVALAAALPELPYACGLNTATMFTADVTDDPLVAVEGELPVRRVNPDRPQGWQAGPAATRAWRERLSSVDPVVLARGLLPAGAARREDEA
jgi:O-succinylbenzoate synthase